MESTLMAILLLSPLVGFLINGFGVRRNGCLVAGTVATLAAALSFVCSGILFFKLQALPMEERHIHAFFFNWISAGTFKADAAFTFDALSALMALIITGVGSLIHLYSIGYMSHDDRPAKYFSYLNLFLFNMLLLVLGDNLLTLFVGWEGVGLCSYLLIGFWFTDPEKAAAGMKAFIANRVGDAGFLLGLFFIFTALGTINFTELAAKNWDTMAEVGMWGPLTLGTLCLFIGATGKSAQIPLYVWLPDAMAGPTPVSALIHAATMVTAGVYMMCRLNFLFSATPNTLMIVAGIGAATAFFAATIGIVQNDIKKILAYSTVSQLGFMVLGVGVGAYTAALFHLMTHAFFKALMFLGSGSIIHAMLGEQDVRKMGGLKNKLPITHWTFVFGWLAIIGTPLFSGFFSKDEILAAAAGSSAGGNMFLWGVGVFTAGLTAFYMTRLMCLTFWGSSRVDSKVLSKVHESPPNMTIPLIVLAALSLVGGYIGIPEVLSHGHIPNGLHGWLHHTLSDAPLKIEHSMELGLMALSVAAAAMGTFAAIGLYLKRPALVEELAARFKLAYKLLYNKYFIDEIYNSFIIQGAIRSGRALWEVMDAELVDGATRVISDFVRGSGAALRMTVSGNVQSYALYIVFGMVVALAMIFAPMLQR